MVWAKNDSSSSLNSGSRVGRPSSQASAVGVMRRLRARTAERVTAPMATDWHQEGIIFRPIRLVEEGRLREDVFGLFCDNVRMPRYQALDLKAQISANFSATV